MVVFTCGHCGESVQKPKVEKHYLTKCRNCNPNLSCMDCFKDFIGKDYELHTKCVTEEERYSGKGFTVKEKKGEKKQTAWVEMLQSVLEEQQGAPKTVLRIIETITKHNNTPRKKPRFINFVKNVCGHKTDLKDIEQAWDIISVKLSALSNINNEANGNKNIESLSKGQTNITEQCEKPENNAKTECIANKKPYIDKVLPKNDKKQQSWVEILQSIIKEQHVSQNVKKIIECVSKYDKPPHKKSKFENMVQDSFGLQINPTDIDKAWEILSVTLPEILNKKNINETLVTNSQDNSAEQNDDIYVNNSQSKTEEQNRNACNTEDYNKDTEEDNGTEEDNKATEVDNKGTKVINGKKISKKQRKQEKKRMKYEAELQSAVAPPEEGIEEDESKKGKKKKKRSDSNTNDDNEIQNEGKNKNKKRKRQDTVNGNHEAVENAPEIVETVLNKEKIQKKKQRTEEELEESICLHDQNVAKIEELCVKDKFNWHAVILSVLQKKGNELPFKRLQKKVLSEYTEITGQEVDDRIADKFIKKLKSAPNVRVDKNRVQLIE